MEIATLSSKKQASLITHYMDAQNVKEFGNLPNVQSLRSALAKRCMNILHMNRDAKKIAQKRSVKKTDPTYADSIKFWSEINFAFKTLFALGYTQEIITVKKGTIIWRRIQRTNTKTGSYAILKCSQKLETTQDYRVMFIYPPMDEMGNATLTDSYFPSVYMSKDIWYFAHSGGSPFATKTLKFQAWDEPFPTYKEDGILLEREQDPNH